MGVTYFVAPIFYVNVSHPERRFFPLKMGKLIERILLKECALYKNPRRCAQFALLFPLLFPTFLEESEENESF